MEMDDRRASVDGYGCGGEGGGGGRFVSWLRAEIQPSKEGAVMIVMVERWRKNNSDGRWCACFFFFASPAAPLALSSVMNKKNG
jgi:hypothetical protein